MQRDPRNKRSAPRASLRKARRHFRKGKYEETLAAAAEVIRLAPGCREAHKLRYVVHIARLDYEGALDDLSGILHYRPDDIEALRGRAMTFLILHRPDRALVDADRAIALISQRAGNVGHPPNRYEMWIIKGISKELGIANPELATLSDLYMTRAGALGMLGRVEEAQGDWRRCFLLSASEDQVRDLDRSELFDRLLHNGEQQQKVGHLMDAIQLYSAALLEIPDSSDARFRRGVAYYEANLHEKASADLIEAWRIKTEQDRKARGYMVVANCHCGEITLALFPHTPEGLVKATALIEDLVGNASLARDLLGAENHLDTASVYEFEENRIEILDWIESKHSAP